MTRINFMKALTWTATFSFSLATLAQKTITVQPGDDVAAIVASSPAGSTFLFSPGTYRLLQLRPLEGDTFIGPSTGHATLDGAQPIKFTEVAGSSPQLWEADMGENPSDINLKCIVGHPLCGQERELFNETNLLMPVGSVDELTPTTWFYDATTGRAIVDFDPTTHWLQVSTVPYAFGGYANHVTIKNLVVERYATPATQGAIGQLAGGSHWTIDGVEVRYNHGGGVQVGPYATIQNSYVHHNGQKGIGAHGAGILVQNNEFSYNNYDWFDYGHEAGGAKFGSLVNAEILNNKSHDNNGAGLWDDSNCIYVHYKGNYIQNNAGAGIQHELGFDAVIENNTILRNGNPPRISMWNGQVSVQNSGRTIVRNNTIVVAANWGSGLVIVNQQRTGPDGAYGPNYGDNDTIEHNDVTFEGNVGQGGLMGVKANAVGNVIDYNTYHIDPTLNHHHFEEFGTKTFEQLQADGYEQHSKIVWYTYKPTTSSAAALK